MSEEATSQSAPPTPEANGHEPKRYKLRRKVINIILEDEDGHERPYQLREMDGDERDRFLERSSRRLKQGRNPHVKDFRGVYSELISFCLYDATGGRVPQVMIQSWPSSVQTDLFKEAQEMNGLTVTAEDEAKND